MRVADWLRELRMQAPSRLALACQDERWTYAELDDQTDRIAAGLAAADVQPDDRVALWMPNCPELLFSYLACFKLGAIAVPLNYRYRQAEASYAIRHSGATSLILHQEKLPEINDAWLKELGVRRTYLVGDTPQTPCEAFATLVAPAGSAQPAPSFDARQVAAIMYTSGTTSRPKGVVHTQESLWRGGRSLAETMQFTPDDVHLLTTSACHCASTLGQFFPCLLSGGSAVLLSAPTAEEMVQAIKRHGVTRCQTLPPALLDMVEYLEQNPTAIPSLKAYTCGGDVVPLDSMTRFRAVTGFDVSELCGMTETVTYAVNPPFGEKRLGSVGLPTARTEVRITNEHGAAASRGETGEIEIRAPGSMVGYWNDTLHTIATLRDGWVASGDLGRLDEDGFLWFVGRKKEIIVHGGSNISPLEVEEVIDSHPAVRSSGVVGQPDPRWGQIVVAFVELREDVSPQPDEAQLREFVAARIAAYKTPERFVVVEALPLGPTGKVDRRQLHARLAPRPTAE